MEESRKRKSTVPMGVFCPAIDQSIDRTNERADTVQTHRNITSNVTYKRAVLDVSLDGSECEQETADSLFVKKSGIALLEQHDSITDSNGDEIIENPQAEEAQALLDNHASKADSSDSLTEVEKSDPLEVFVNQMDRFAVKARESSSRGDDQLGSDVYRADGIRDQRRLNNSATDLGHAMKALFDNRNASEWAEPVRAEGEIDTDDGRETAEAAAGNQEIEANHTKSPVVSHPVQNDVDDTAVAEPMIVVGPSNIEPLSSLAPLETNNAQTPRLPLIKGGVAGAATAIVLLAVTTWAVIESRGTHTATEQDIGSTSPTKSMVQADLLARVTPRIAQPKPRVEPHSNKLVDTEALDNPADRTKKSTIKRASGRAKRAVKSNRREAPQTKVEPTPLIDTASAEREPVDAIQKPAPALEPLPQTPSRDEIFATLTSLRSQVRKCVEHKAGIAELDINIKSSGRVSQVVVHGDFRGTKQGSCIARVVRKARFNPFERPDFRVLFPYSF